MRATMRRARHRSFFLLAFACLLLGIVEARLFQLQVLRARSPSNSSIYKHLRLEEEGRRGDVRDARGGLLATSVREVDVRVWTTGVVATKRRDARAELAERLAELCGVDPEETLRKLARPDRWTLLASGIRDPRVIAELRDLCRRPGLHAVTLETRFVRDYPRGAVLAPLLGWTAWQPCSRDPSDPLFEPEGVTRGVAGIEARFESELAPRRGHRIVEQDGRQREMVDPELACEPAADGRTVVLTIEPLAQSLVEEAVDAAVTEYSPGCAQIVVLDPGSAEVLAVAQRPTPAQPRPSGGADESSLHHLLPMERVYPPGSSFKPFMLGLVLERGAATPDQLIDCEHGAAKFRSRGHARTIHDSHPHGTLTATQVLVESSNIGMTKLVLGLVPADVRKGDAAFRPVLDHVARLGFGAPVHGFVGEASAMVPALADTDSIYTLASLAFGQGISVTALQMAAACAAVANGGTWRPATFLRAVGLASPRTAFTPPTAAVLRTMLQRVVEQGATRSFRPRGWSMGGKTGTAEDERRHKTPVTSYWCFAPVVDPRFLVLVVLDDPKRGRFAADNAAKVAAGLMGRLLERFEVARDRPDEASATGTRGAVVVSRPVGEGR